jgi:ABC-type amino acid transport substrate-binding protein
MNYLRVTFASLLLSTGILGSQLMSAKAQDDALQVGIYQNAPKVYLTSDGEATGFWPELLAAIAAAEGWSLDYVPCEWDDCLDAVEAGQLDLMLDVSYSAERERRFDFNTVPVVSTWSVVYVPQGARLNSLIDLENRRLGVLADGIQYEDLVNRLQGFDIDLEFAPAADYDTLLQWLDEGRIDAVAINRFTGSIAEQQHPIRPTDILVAPTQVHFVAPKGQNADVLAAIDKGLQQFKEDTDSVYYELQAQWLAVESPLDWQALKRGIGISGGVALLLLLLSMLLWNRRMQAVVAQRTQAETALRESENWLKRVLAIAEIICWEVDLRSGQIKVFGFYAADSCQTNH